MYMTHGIKHHKGPTGMGAKVWHIIERFYGQHLELLKKPSLIEERYWTNVLKYWDSPKFKP